MDDLVERVARAICSHHLAHVNHCTLEEVERYIVDNYWNTPEYLDATRAAIAECFKLRDMKDAPRDGTWILCYGPWPDKMTPAICSFVNNKWGVVHDYEDYAWSDYTPTGWPPLPEPPKETEKEKQR